MKLRLLGRSGLRVSELALGAMTFGTGRGAWGATREESRAVFDAYVEAGGNFVDTANGYQLGESETLVGEFVRGRRDEFVVATKYSLGTRDSTNPNASGNHRKSMVAGVEASLRRLGLDYIDLYWVHAWDGLTPDEEVMRALDDLVSAGKVLYIGVSDTPAWVISRSQAIAQLRGWSQFAAVQFTYNLLERTPERDLVPMATDLGLSMTVWGALAGGVLTGKYKPGAEATAGRLADATFRNRGLTDRNFEIVAQVQSIADELGAAPSHVALAWLRSRSPSIIPIIGARTEAQLRDNLGCLSVTLDDDQSARLDAATAQPLGFPHEFLASPAIEPLLTGAFRDRLAVRRRGEA